MKRRSESQARSDLRARLEARREEIDAAILTRVSAIADPREIADPAYADGLRRALGAAIEFGLETIESGEGHDPPIPVDLLAQARLAARNGIALDTVLRRYFAGYSLLGFYLIEEASRDGLMDGPELQRLTATQAGRFDRLLAALGEEHAREADALASSASKSRQSEHIERLLAGEPVDTAEIPYDFEGWHVGLVAAGPGGEPVIRELAAGQDCSLLLLRWEEDAVWAWLSSRRCLDPAELLGALGSHGPFGRGTDDTPSSAIAFGEPAESLPGWRLTHRQAAAALPVARRDADRTARYAEVALLAAALQDDLLADSLRRLYLEPLQRGRDGGHTLRHTLLAYLGCERNAASTAATLGVTRQTVNSRLRMIEERIGRPVSSCGGELEVALRLQSAEPAFPGKANPAHN